MLANIEWRREARRYLFTGVGGLICGVAINAFFVPHYLLSGGIAGIRHDSALSARMADRSDDRGFQHPALLCGLPFHGPGVFSLRPLWIGNFSPSP
jgi:hypothetical protein